MARHLVEHLLLIGKLAGLELRVEQFLVNRQLEAAAAGGDQLQVFDLLFELGQDLGRQTDGSWLVVSNRAVFQRDVHLALSSGKETVYFYFTQLSRLRRCARRAKPQAAMGYSPSPPPPAGKRPSCCRHRFSR